MRWKSVLLATLLLASCTYGTGTVAPYTPPAVTPALVTLVPATSEPTPVATPALTPSAGLWTAAADTSTYFAGHSATLLADGRVLVAGGDPPIGELYDPAMNAWTRTGEIQQLRPGHTATLLSDGRVLVSGISYVQTRSAKLYDPATGTWSATGSLIEARYDHTATLLSDGRVLVVGGHDGGSPFANVFNSAELYDPATGTWSATGSMAGARSSHTATLLSDGRVLVASGIDRRDDTAVDPVHLVASAELYDPYTGTWSATGSLTEARSDHTATLLSDGRVLVAGGITVPDESYPAASDSAELYEPATGSWTTSGVMLDARVDHAAALLSDGRVLVVGVWADDSDIKASAEVWNPATGSWTATERRRADCVAPTATVLPDGRVLVVGGYTMPYQCLTELYEPAGV